MYENADIEDYEPTDEAAVASLGLLGVALLLTGVGLYKVLRRLVPTR